MNGNDERSIVPVNADKLIGSQGNNVASSRSTIKIDSLCIKLGIEKPKGDAPKCRHFSIRGYVAGMRETTRSNNLPPFTEQLPPMDIPNFRYWLCQRCLQNDGTESASNETPLPSVCGQCLVKPSSRSRPPQHADGIPFGEGTSGLKSGDSRNDNVESILDALRAHKSQSSQEIPANVKVYEELSKHSTINTNTGAPDRKESTELRDHEDPQKTCIVNETITSVESQLTERGQQNDSQNGNPRRKVRKVRLLKELLCKNTKTQQQENETSSLAVSSQIKRKMSHDHDHNNDHDKRPVDSKKAKAFKGNAAAKNSVVEGSRNPEASKGGETSNKYQWNKHGTQRSSTHGKVGNDAITAWRSIFSDMGRTDKQVTPTNGVSKGRGTEPYSNFMSPPKSDKKANTYKKISSNPLKHNKFFAEESRRLKDRQSGAELGLGLSLNYNPQALVRSQPSIFNRPPTQDYSRKFGFFSGEPSNIAHRIPLDSNSKEGSVYDIGSRHPASTEVLHEKRPYTQLPYGNFSRHQKLDFSDPHRRNNGVRGYPDTMRPYDHQRQEKMFSIGRSDEREIIELMAKNQYERNLCEARSHFAPNTSGFHKVNNVYEGMPSSHPEYLNMIRPASPFPTSKNVCSTTMRNYDSRFFHQDQVSSLTMFDPLKQSQKQPTKGIWISDSGPQRHYDSHYHHVSNSNNRIPQTHLYNPTNMQVLEAFNKHHNGTRQNDVLSTVPACRPYGDTFAKYSEKDKGKSVMDLDLNVVAPIVVEEQNNLEYFDMNPKRMSSLDSSYSNEAIPAMQLLSLMDAGKSSQSFNMNGQKFTKPLSPGYSHCSSALTEKTAVNLHFPYSGMRPSIQNPTGSSYSNVFQTGQNVKLTYSHGQQGYHKLQEEKSRGTSVASVSHGCRLEDSYVFPLPWHATEDVNKLANRVIEPRFDSSRIEVCSINQNPADFTTPGPENAYMIGAEDLISNGEICYTGKSASDNVYG